MKDAFQLVREQVMSDMKEFFERLEKYQARKRNECDLCKGAPTPVNNPCQVCGASAKPEGYHEGYAEGYADGLNMGREFIEDLRAKVERLEAKLAKRSSMTFDEWYAALPEDEDGFKCVKGIRVNEGHALMGWHAHAEVSK